MRYQNIDTISFEDVNRNTHAVKDMREYPTYRVQESIRLKKGDRLDEIASRPEFYGDETEGESYKLFEHNREVIYEAKFDLTQVRLIEVPVR